MLYDVISNEHGAICFCLIFTYPDSSHVMITWLTIIPRKKTLATNTCTIRGNRIICGQSNYTVLCLQDMTTFIFQMNGYSFFVLKWNNSLIKSYEFLLWVMSWFRSTIYLFTIELTLRKIEERGKFRVIKEDSGMATWFNLTHTNKRITIKLLCVYKCHHLTHNLIQESFTLFAIRFHLWSIKKECTLPYMCISCYSLLMYSLYGYKILNIVLYSLPFSVYTIYSTYFMYYFCWLYCTIVNLKSD